MVIITLSLFGGLIYNLCVAAVPDRIRTRQRCFFVCGVVFRGNEGRNSYRRLRQKL